MTLSIMVGVVMLSVANNAFMLSVIMLNVVILSVVAPPSLQKITYKVQTTFTLRHPYENN